MIINLDRSSDVPLGTQLAWQLRAAIAAGSLRPGDRLPGVRELAAEAAVNVNTVRAVYGRLAEQGAIVSEHGRGTFVRDGGAARGGVGELVERVAGEARRRRVDPRELAALLYARAEAGGGDEAAGGAASAADEIAERRALRAEIEALEHQLATLEAPRATGAGARADEGLPERLGAAVGARLVSARELAATRDALAERVSARRAELRGARAAARRRALEPPQRPRPEPDSAWPELLAGAAGLRARRA
jgi:DNA-binding transcriptional regulator YhcF (GntR family)